MFHNEDTGVCLLKVKAKGYRHLVTVVGSLASISLGEWMTAEGRWIQDRETESSVINSRPRC